MGYRNYINYKYYTNLIPYRKKNPIFFFRVGVDDPSPTIVANAATGTNCDTDYLMVLSDMIIYFTFTTCSGNINDRDIDPSHHNI